MSIVSSGSYFISNWYRNFPIGANPSAGVDPTPIYSFSNTTAPQAWTFELQQTVVDNSGIRSQGIFKTAGGYLVVQPIGGDPIDELGVYTSVAASKEDAAVWDLRPTPQHGQNVYVVNQKDAASYKSAWALSSLTDPKYPLHLGASYSTPSIPPNWAPNFLYKIVPAPLLEQLD